MKIEVLGPGCPKCHALADSVGAALTELGLSADVTQVTDIMEITSRGVMATPALIIDGQVKVTGRVPSDEEIRKFLGSV